MKKFLGCAAIYICITLITAYGWVFFTRPGDNQYATSPQTPDESIQMPTVTPPESLALDNILTGLMSTPALQFDFNVDLCRPAKEPLALTGDLYLDFSQGLTTPVVQATLVLRQNTLTLTYQDNWLYVTAFGGQYKVSTDSMLDLVQVITNFADASQTTPDEQANQFANDLVQNTDSGFDLNQILDSLQNLTDEETADGHAISFSLFEIGVYLNTDLDYHLTQITTDTLTVADYQITPTVDCTYLDELREITVDAADYTDLSSLNAWVDAFLNTAQLTDWYLTGTLQVDLTSLNINMAIPLDLQIKLVDKKPQIKAELGPIPVIAPIDNDVPYIFGDTVSGIYAGLNRILQVYYVDGYVYFYRSEEVPVFPNKKRTYEKRWKVTLDEFLADPMMLLSYGCGFTDTVMKQIDKAMDLAKNRENTIDPNNVLLGVEMTPSELNLLLNLQELANNPQLGSLSLSLFTTQSEGKNYVGRAQMAVDMPLSDSFTMSLSCDDLTLDDIGQPLDWTAFAEFIRDYNSKYQTDEQWEASNGKWTKTSAVVYTINFESNGGPELSSITGPVGTTFVVPVLDDRVIDDGVTRDTYTFIGWYTDPDFAPDSVYTNGVITRHDLTLYALWEVTTQTYRQVVICNDKLQTYETFYALPGTEFDLATTFANVVVMTDTERQVYAFDGWYTDEEFQTAWTGDKVVPDYNLSLYAKWVVVSNANLYTVVIVDTKFDTPTITLAGFAGDALDLASYANRYQTVVVDDGSQTKQETYTFAGFDQDLTVFPSQDITIYVQWDCDTKYYYTITFSKDTDSRGVMLKNNINFPIESLRVLEGTTIDLTQYLPTWEQRGIFGNYRCDFQGWTTIREGDTMITSLTVTGTTTIYAKWSQYYKAWLTVNAMDFARFMCYK